MFRGPSILTRSLLLCLRDAHLPGSCFNAGVTGCHASSQNTLGNEDIIEGVAEQSSSKETELISELSLDLIESSSPNHTKQGLSLGNHVRHKLSTSTKSKQGEHFSQTTRALSTRNDFVNSSDAAAGIQPQRRCCDFEQLTYSFINKTGCQQSYSSCRSHFTRLNSSLTHSSCVFSRLHNRLQPCSSSFCQSRSFHAAPSEVATFRDCLSAQNEERCRHHLGPNVKHYEVDKEKRQSGQRNARWASVLVSLCSVDGEPAFLFTLRSSTLKGRHKGDVSFAGGKSDPVDKDVVATALREAREELGINVGKESVWGVLRPLRDMSGMMIAPVLANLGPFEELSFKPNPAEVDEIFTMSVSHLCNPQNRGYTHFRTGNKYGYTTPVFCNGKHKVWGLTAVALDHTLKLIISP